MDVVAQGNLFSFFYDRVKAAQGQGGEPLAEDAEFYLVRLLVEYRETPRLLEAGGRRIDDRAFAIRLLESRQAPPAQRWAQLKHVADTTLYLLGLFSESLRRRAVDLRYYQQLGRSAYDELSSLGAGARGAARDPLFAELVDRFDRCVEVVGEAGEDEARTDRDILHLYEQWRDLGSERAHRRLRDMGILAAPAPKGSVH